MFSVLGLGFLLGLRHATDADHIAAITTFVSREQSIRTATRIGVLWGIGHSASVTLVAIPVILFSLTLPPKLGLGFEFFVGVMLVALGLATIIIHSHTHQHKSHQTHTHEHVHFLGLFHTIRPLIVGLVHGLAGSAAITLLVLSTIKDPRLSIVYLLIFHFGVISGMMLITTAFGTTVILIKKKSESIHKYLIFASGVFSLAFGLYIMYQTGMLFSAV